MSHWNLTACEQTHNLPFDRKELDEASPLMDAALVAAVASYGEYSCAPVSKKDKSTAPTTCLVQADESKWWDSKLPPATQKVVMVAKDHAQSPSVLAPTTNMQAVGLKMQGADNKQVCLLGFRGSATVKNFVDDAKSPPFVTPLPVPWMPSSEMVAHRGILESYLALRDQVRQFATGCDRVHVTGHSLGGAEAQLAASDLANDNVKVGSVITFEAPRLFNHAAAAQYNQSLKGVKTLHVTAARDIVPHLPPQMPPFNMERTGEEIFYNTSKPDTPCNICTDTRNVSRFQCSDGNFAGQPKYIQSSHCVYDFGGNTQDLCTPEDTASIRWFTDLTSPSDMLPHV